MPSAHYGANNPPLNTFTFNFWYQDTDLHSAVPMPYNKTTIRHFKQCLAMIWQHWMWPGLTDLWRVGGTHMNPDEHRNSEQKGPGFKNQHKDLVGSTSASLWPQTNKTKKIIGAQTSSYICQKQLTFMTF